MKQNKFVEWLKSPKSDFVLLVIVLVLLNVVALNGFFRFDLTSSRSYSLSKSSKQVVKTLEEPLCVKVFFSKNLPSPYNTIEQYLKDLLVEYKGAANNNFSYEFYNMDKEESQKIASEYRIRQKQIQEVKDNEVGFKNVYMGLALVYADTIEVLDDISNPNGLEYTLTNTMTKMINTTGALAGLEGRVKLTLYYSKALSDFGIKGFDRLESAVSSACNAVNKKNLDKIDFEVVDPDSETLDELAQKYGISVLTWGNSGKGTISAVIEYGDNFKILPISLARGFFGSYSIAGIEGLEDSISESLSALVSRWDQIAYVTSGGCRSLSQSDEGAFRLEMLVSDKYELLELDLETEEIPSTVKNLVINGPTQKFSKKALYKLDQFLMKGGNLTVFADTMKEIPGETEYSFPTYEVQDTGLSEFLASYGIILNNDYVMDMNCYEQFQQGYGKIPLYFIPSVDQSGLNQKNDISKNLAYVFTAQNSSIEVDEKPSIKYSVIAESSPSSWSMSENIVLHPMYLNPPDKKDMAQKKLAVLAEGKFTSQFDSNPDEKDTDSKSTIDIGTSHLSKAVQNGKIFVMGTSTVTTPMLIDEQGSQPIALFVRNVFDYMNGNQDLCKMRTKGLSLNTLKNSSVASIRTAKIFNQYVLPLLIVAAGIVVWRIRVRHRKHILETYASTDNRETLISKGSEK